MTEEEFRQMCIKHDLTFAFSDDHSYWAAGQRSMDRINEARKLLDPEVVVRIWNEVVDTKIVKEARSTFYWSTDGISSSS